MTTKLDKSDKTRPAPSVLTAQDVAAQLDLALSTVYFYAETGQLPAMRIGKHWRFPKQGIERLLNGHKGARR